MTYPTTWLLATPYTDRGTPHEAEQLQPNDCYWHADECQDNEREPIYDVGRKEARFDETDDQWLDRVTGSNLLGRVARWLAKLGG